MVKQIIKSKGAKMNNKPKTNSIQHESNELLQYKLESAKKDNRKNMIIAILVTAIITFASGYILSYNMNCSQMNLVRENESLKAENLKLEASALKEQTQNNQ